MSVLVLVVALVLLLVAAGPAWAQADEPAVDGLADVDGAEGDALEGDAAEGRISDTENENRIDRAVLGLLIVAFSLAVLTLLFWWHTQPQRRARALDRRDEAPVVDPVPPPDEPAPAAATDPELPVRPVPQGAERG